MIDEKLFVRNIKFIFFVLMILLLFCIFLIFRDPVAKKNISVDLTLPVEVTNNGVSVDLKKIDTCEELYTITKVIGIIQHNTNHSYLDIHSKCIFSEEFSESEKENLEQITDFLRDRNTYGLKNTPSGKVIYKKQRELIVLIKSFSINGFVSKNDFFKFKKLLEEIYSYKKSYYKEEELFEAQKELNKSLKVQELSIDSLESIKLTKEEIKEFNRLIINNRGTINIEEKK